MEKIVIIFILSLTTLGTIKGRTVSFTRVIIDSGMPGPHGDWAGDIDGTSPKYQLDVFATYVIPGVAVWYKNNGLGTSWSTEQVIWNLTNTSHYNYEIAGCNLDGDGDIDAVSCNAYPFDSGRICIHTNLGGGTFTTKEIGPINAMDRQMRVRDMDGDGDSDIVVTAWTNRFCWDQTDVGVYWFENKGSMNFTKHFIGMCNAWKVDCFDDDGDKHLDVVVSESYHGDQDSALDCKLILYRNNGAEGFTPVILDNSYSRGWGNAGGAGVRCADLNNNGKSRYNIRRCHQ